MASKRDKRKAKTRDETMRPAAVEPVRHPVERLPGEPTVAVNLRMPEALRAAYTVEAGSRAMAQGRNVTAQQVMLEVLREAIQVIRATG